MSWISTPGLPARKNVAPGRVETCWTWKRGQSRRAEFGEQPRGVSRRRFHALQRHQAAGEVVVLDVDQQERGWLLHGSLTLRGADGFEHRQPVAGEAGVLAGAQPHVVVARLLGDPEQPDCTETSHAARVLEAQQLARRERPGRGRAHSALLLDRDRAVARGEVARVGARARGDRRGAEHQRR